MSKSCQDCRVQNKKQPYRKCSFCLCWKYVVEEQKERAVYFYGAERDDLRCETVGLCPTYKRRWFGLFGLEVVAAKMGAVWLAKKPESYMKQVQKASICFECAKRITSELTS